MRNGWVVVVALVAGCRTFPPIDLKTLPSADDHPNSKFVVLLDETDARYVPEGPAGAPQLVVTERRRVLILKPTTPPPLFAWYERSFTRVESMRGRIVKPDGTEEPLDESMKSDHPMVRNFFFTENRVIELPVPPLPIGAIFESEIVTRYLDVKPFVIRRQFGGDAPVVSARVIVTAPKDWTIRWQVRAFDGETLTAAEVTEGDSKRWAFEKNNLDPIRREPKGPSSWAVIPSVAIRLEEWLEKGQKQQAFATPEALSAWLAAQYAERAQVTPELEREVKEVLANVPDEPEAKARALYEHACRSIQYCAIQVGYGGWIPHAASAVQAGRYGDCKDKAIYLHTLLKIAGVSSAPTLIFAHEGTPMPFQLPSLGANFNHVILSVDLPGGRTVYADPTSRAVPFGQLPPSDQEATVLELRPGSGAPLKTTPASESTVNAERQTLKLSVDSRGDGSGTVRLDTRGASALEVKHRLLGGKGKLSDWLRDRLWMRTTHVDSARPLPSGDFADIASVEGEVAVPHVLLRAAQGDALFRVSDVFASWAQPLGRQRKTDVVSFFAETRESLLTLQLPAGTQVLSLPKDEDFESDDAVYQLRWKKTETGLEVRRRLIEKRRVIPAAQVADANGFSRQVRVAEHGTAVLRFPVNEASR